MTEKKLKSLERKCYEAESKLNHALADLANAASEILGFEVIADICNGSEIEFRQVDKFGSVDDFDCIRMEGILSKL